jgi:nucleotide-binding universal stress UspA family protein
MNSFPNKILLATDGSEDADLAARAAIELSNRTASELHVVHVWHDVPTPHFHSFVRAQLRQEAEETLQRQLERIEKAGGTVAKAHLREGRTVDEILDLSEELEVGLLIVGSRGLGGVGRILLGSVSEGIVHHARRPVLVVPGGQDAWPAGTQSPSTVDTVLATGALLSNSQSTQPLTSAAPDSNMHTV